MKSRKPVVPLQVTLLFIVLLCLIPPFAWLQYQWSGVVSQAEERRMRENLRLTGLQFLSTLDNEVTVIHDMLEAERSTATVEDSSRFVEQAVAFWTQNASWPDLLTTISVVSLANDSRQGQLHYIIRTYAKTATGGFAWRDQAFEKADPRLQSSILSLPFFQEDAKRSRQRNETPAFFFPRIISVEPPVAVISAVDPEVLAHAVLPALAERYFGEPDGLPGYALQVVEQSSKKEVFASQHFGGQNPGDPVLRLLLLGSWRNDHVEVSGDTPHSPDFPRVRYWLQSNDRPPPPPSNAPWVLQVYRVNGSFEEVSSRVLWINLTGSLGLLVIIAPGLAWLYRMYRQSRLLEIGRAHV